MRKLLAAVAAVAVAAMVVAATPARAADGISCRYVLHPWTGSTGFQADLWITNNTGATINGWTAHWTFNEPTELGIVWGAQMVQRASDVTATSTPWNGQIASGSLAMFGWTGFAANSTVPADITVNGTPC